MIEEDGSSPVNSSSYGKVAAQQQQLAAAGKQGQFINHYQPIVQVLSGSIVGFEALTRWQHPIRGLLLPSDFLKTAEESESIVLWKLS